MAPTTTTAATTSTATITSGGANEKLGLIVTVDNRVYCYCFNTCHNNCFQKPDTDPTVRDKSNLRKRKGWRCFSLKFSADLNFSIGGGAEEAIGGPIQEDGCTASRLLFTFERSGGKHDQVEMFFGSFCIFFGLWK